MQCRLHPAPPRWWISDSQVDKISFASLDGSGAGDLDTSGVAGGSPWGLAL
jgi:hypothetical protein